MDTCEAGSGVEETKKVSNSGNSPQNKTKKKKKKPLCILVVV